MRSISEKIGRWITGWLTEERPSADWPLYDFDRLCYEMCPVATRYQGKAAAVISRSPESRAFNFRFVSWSLGTRGKSPLPPFLKGGSKWEITQ